MIWAVRGALGVSIVALAVLALRPGEAPTPVAAPAPPAPTATPDAPAPVVLSPPTPRPTSKPEVVISRATQAIAPAASGPVVPQVQAIEFSYAPQQLSVSPGTLVTFRNSGAEGHDFLGGGPDGTWWSGPLAPHETYQRPFAHPGSYDFVCTFHPEMHGTILVTPDAHVPALPRF